MGKNIRDDVKSDEQLDCRSANPVNVNKEREIKGLLKFLTQDRGGTNFKKIYEKIPEKYYEYLGFAIILLMIALLSVEEVNRIFVGNPKVDLYMWFFYLVGGLGEIFAVVYIGSVFADKEKPSLRKILKTHIWDLALCMMLIWSIMSSFLSEYRDTAIGGTGYRHDGLMTYFVYAGMYVCGRAVKSDKLRIWILRSVGIVLTLLSFISILQTNVDMLMNWGKIGKNLLMYNLYSAIFFNPNHFGYFLVIGLMALAGLVMIEKKMAVKITWLLIFGFDMWALIINNTFGCYLAVLFGIIFLSVIILIHDKEKYKAVIAVATVFIAVSVGMNTYNHQLSSDFRLTYHQSKEVKTNDDAGSGRIGLWKQAVKYIEKKPVFGYGPEGLVLPYFIDGFENDRPHNEYLQHAAFLGIPGLVFYLAALVTIFVHCIKKIRRLSPYMLVAGGIVFAYCVSAFFGNTMYYTTPYYFIFLGVLSACHLESKKQ